MTVKRILGIDPGSRITGIGIIEHSNTHLSTICLLKTQVSLVVHRDPACFGVLFLAIQEAIHAFQPTECAIEQVFMHKNARSALKLGQARGAALAAMVLCQLPVYEYAPRRIKQAIVGQGGAEKNQVQHMVQLLLKLEEKPQADTADALAVALCHLHTGVGTVRARSGRRFSKRSTGWKSYDRTTSR